MEAVILSHVQRYPLLEIEDLYKVVHQSSLGSEHAVSDPDWVRLFLEEELASLDPAATAQARPEEPLLDPISADGGIVRVHLRPWKAARLPSAPLFQAFLETALRHRGDQEDLRRSIETALALAKAGRVPFAQDAATTYLAAREAEGFPAVHHSNAYVTAYAPAYRVVHRRALARHMPSLDRTVG